MKAAVFVSAGIGDALLLVPLVKALKADGHSVTGVFTSPHNCQQLFEGTGLFDKLITGADGLGMALKRSVQHHNQYDVAYVNIFAATRKNLIMAGSMAKEVITNHLPPNLPAVLTKGIHSKKPVKGIHDAQQNLNLFTDTETLDKGDLQIDLPTEKVDLPTPYFAVQISAGNNSLKYKNWPIEHWIELLKLLIPKYPHYQFVLIGDENELELSQRVLAAELERVQSLVGQTSIKELTGVLKHAELLIGLDGGPMHICAALAKPTFTLWGISDPQMYSYQHIGGNQHMVLCKNDAPKHSWLNNTGADLTLPQYLNDLEPQFVADQFQAFEQTLAK